jgi:hypothetical protein
MKNPNINTDICIPNEVLQSEHAFELWYQRLKNRLFPQIVKVYVTDIKQDPIKKEIKDLFEKIIIRTNLIFNKKNEAVRYSKKTRKFTPSDILVISISCNIVVSYYDISLTVFSKITGINRSTMFYYIRKHNNSFIYKEYLEKYNELLINLNDEGLISTTKAL